MTALIAYYWYALVLAFGIGMLTAWLAWGAPAADEPVAFEPDEDAGDIGDEAYAPSSEPRAYAAVGDVEAGHESDAADEVFAQELVDEAGPADETAAGEADAAPLETWDVDPVDAGPAEPERSADEETAPPAPVMVPVDDELGPAIAAASEPEAIPMEPAEEPVPHLEPAGGAPDDLLMIKGIGPQLARLLNSLGVRRFDDIASWLPEDIEMIDAHLGMFRGRIIRDEWIQQARLLARGDMEAFNERYGHLPF